jgi:hypothetical protein
MPEPSPFAGATFQAQCWPRCKIRGLPPCHVPLHWQEKVHKDLVRDVKLGVLEKLPTNTPTTWLSHMVVTAKSNGDPRRTVDYQPLNKYVQTDIPHGDTIPAGF